MITGLYTNLSAVGAATNNIIIIGTNRLTAMPVTAETPPVQPVVQTVTNEVLRMASVNHKSGFFLVFGMVLGVVLAFYLFYAFCLKRICDRCGEPSGILVWIPILNIIPMLRAAGLPVWMFVLYLIPVINCGLFVVMWARICQRRGKSAWLVLLMFLPVVNLLFVPYLAFSE
jgi:hypothetical protein